VEIQILVVILAEIVLAEVLVIVAIVEALVLIEGFVVVKLYLYSFCWLWIRLE
jgi:hypothetical protein